MCHFAACLVARTCTCSTDWLGYGCSCILRSKEQKVATAYLQCLVPPGSSQSRDGHDRKASITPSNLPLLFPAALLFLLFPLARTPFHSPTTWVVYLLLYLWYTLLTTTVLSTRITRLKDCLCSTKSMCCNHPRCSLFTEWAEDY